MWSTWRYVFWFLLIVVFAVAFGRVYVWKQYNPLASVNSYYYLKLILTFFMGLCHSFAIIMYFLLFIISGIWYVFYKYQGTASFLVPSNEDPLEKLQYQDFYVILYCYLSNNPQLVWYIAAISMFCYIFYQIYRQSNVDILFIDWEKPKEYFKGGETKRGVSIWRTLLCCNEFNEL